MAIQPRTSRIRLQDGTNANWREWVATADAENYERGALVTVTITMTTGGLAPPSPATLLDLDVMIDGALNANGSFASNPTYSLQPNVATQTLTFYFTHTGRDPAAATNPGSPRLGLLQIYLYAERTGDPVSGNNYSVSSTRVAATTPTGFDLVNDQGYIRGNPRADEPVVSYMTNAAAAGGAKIGAFFAYGDAIRQRVTLPVTPFADTDFGFTHEIRRVSDNMFVQSASSSGTGAVNVDASTNLVITDVYTRALSRYRAAFTVRNGGLGVPWLVVPASTLDEYDVDPRIRFVTLMQKNTSRYTTATEGAHFLDVAAQQMLDSDIGYLLKRAHNMRDEPLLTTLGWAEGLRDVGNQLSDRTRAVATNNIASEPRPGGAGSNSGWGYPTSAPGWMIWNESKPGGGWVYNVRSISTAGATAAGMIVDGETTLTMLAQSPALLPLSQTGGMGANTADHWRPGDALLLGCGLFSDELGTFVTPDTEQVSIARLLRFNEAGGYTEYLNSDMTWVRLSGHQRAYEWPLGPPSQAGSDDRLRLRMFTDTSSFTTTDVIVIFRIYYGGTPYLDDFPLEAVARTAARHDRHTVNPIHVAL